MEDICAGGYMRTISWHFYESFLKNELYNGK